MFTIFAILKISDFLGYDYVSPDMDFSAVYEAVHTNIYEDMNLDFAKSVKSMVNENGLFKNMEDFIQQKMKLKEKTIKRNKNYLENNSMRDINLNIGELIMNSGEEYRLKNEALNLIEKNKNKKYVLPNVNQNWEMSLRRPKNIVGSRKELLNFGTQNYPYWFIATEKIPQFNEHISKPKKDFTISSYGALTSRTNSIQNLFNL